MVRELPDLCFEQGLVAVDALVAVPCGDFVWQRSVLVLLKFGAICVPYRLDGERNQVNFGYCGGDGSLLRGGVCAVEDSESPHVVESPGSIEHVHAKETL